MGAVCIWLLLMYYYVWTIVPQLLWNLERICVGSFLIFTVLTKILRAVGIYFSVIFGEISGDWSWFLIIIHKSKGFRLVWDWRFQRNFCGDEDFSVSLCSLDGGSIPSEVKYTLCDWRGRKSEGFLLSILSSVSLELAVDSIFLEIGVLNALIYFEWRRGWCMCQGSVKGSDPMVQLWWDCYFIVSPVNIVWGGGIICVVGGGRVFCSIWIWQVEICR